MEKVVMKNYWDVYQIVDMIGVISYFLLVGIVGIQHYVLIFKMQVDRTNFQILFPQILKRIEQADFVAFDCEFTGLVTQLQRIEGMFSNHIQFYQRIKQTAFNFRIIQLGLATFAYREGTYFPSVFNIFITPDTFTHAYNNVMVCQVESMEFLAKNGIDFNRVFCKGIKTRRLYANDIQQKHEYNQFPITTIDNIFLSPEQQQYANQIQTNTVDKIIDNDKIEKFVDFKNKTVFNYFRTKYPDMLFDKTKKNMKQFQYTIHFRPAHKSLNYSKNEDQIKYKQKQKCEYKQKVKQQQIKKQNEKTYSKNQELKNEGSSEKQQKEQNIMKEQQQKTSPQQGIQVKKQHKINYQDDQQAQIQKPVKQDLKNKQLACISKIFASLITGRKPLVGHFPNLDIGLIYQTFLCDLPETYEQFCLRLNQVFPQIYDTKVLSRRLQSKLKGLKVDLSSLFKACYNSKLLKPYSNFDITGLQQYVSKEHQAGYDAFITGCSFIGMTNFLSGRAGRINFKAIQQQNMLLYSRYGGQISINGSGYSSNALNYPNTIIIKGAKKQQYKQWQHIAKQLSKFGSLIVHQDHNEIYFVFEQPKNIAEIIKLFPDEYLKQYSQRRIIFARNMYKKTQNLLI